MFASCLTKQDAPGTVAAPSAALRITGIGERPGVSLRCTGQTMSWPSLPMWNWGSFHLDTVKGLQEWWMRYLPFSGCALFITLLARAEQLAGSCTHSWDNLPQWLVHAASLPSDWAGGQKTGQVRASVSSSLRLAQTPAVQASCFVHGLRQPWGKFFATEDFETWSRDPSVTGTWLSPVAQFLPPRLRGQIKICSPQNCSRCLLVHLTLSGIRNLHCFECQKTFYKRGKQKAYKINIGREKSPSVLEHFLPNRSSRGLGWKGQLLTNLMVLEKYVYTRWLVTSDVLKCSNSCSVL